MCHPLVTQPVLELRVGNIEPLEKLGVAPAFGTHQHTVRIETDPARLRLQAVDVGAQADPNAVQALPQAGRALLRATITPKLVLQPSPAAAQPFGGSDERQQALCLPRFRGQVLARAIAEAEGPDKVKDELVRHRPFGQRFTCNYRAVVHRDPPSGPDQGGPVGGR